MLNFHHCSVHCNLKLLQNNKLQNLLWVHGIGVPLFYTNMAAKMVGQKSVLIGAPYLSFETLNGISESFFRVKILVSVRFRIVLN
jgi:hypothetical protein